MISWILYMGMSHIFNIQYFSSAPCASALGQAVPEWGNDMRCNNTNWSAISENQLWGSGTIMTGNTGTTIQVRHSAGICAATSLQH